MAQALANPTIVINNVSILIAPNTAVYTEGKGEQTQRAQSGGGGTVDLVFSKNVESFMSKFNIEMFPTKENIELIRTWKSNDNANAISIVDTGFNRSIANAALINDYEVNLGADTTISLEFVGSQAA